MQPDDEFDDLDLPPITADEFRATARRDFPSFYARASAYEIEVMDALVLVHAALVVGMNAPRQGVAPDIRDDLERKTDEVERTFIACRDAVQRSATFGAILREERLKIEGVLFEVRPPLG